MLRLAIGVLLVLLAAPAALAQNSSGADDLNRRVVEYLERGMAAEALPIAQRALELARIEQPFGRGELRVADATHNLEQVYLRLGHLADAEHYAKQCLEIRQRKLGNNHAEVAVALHDLAFVYKEQGRFNDAEPLLKQSLAVAEKVHGLVHAEVAGMLNDLALLYRDEGRYADAEPAMKRALEIREKTLGYWHIDVAKSLNSLAQLYGDLKRYKEQEEMLKRSLEIREKVLGPQHPALATALDNMAFYYTSQGAFDKAEPLAKRALSIYRAAYGPNNRDVAITLGNLVSLYEKQNRLADVERLLKESLEILENTAGADDPLVADALWQLGEFYFHQGDWSRAVEAWRRDAQIVAQRTLRDAEETGKPLATGGQKANVRESGVFTALVKAAYRAAPKGSEATGALAREMFEMAQWAQNSQAAASLLQMAARGASGDPALASIVRGRQALVEEWRKLDAMHTAAVSQPPERRNKAMEAQISERLADLGRRIAGMDERLTAEFPEYGEFSSPAPVPVQTVQALLGPEEALVLILDTGKFDTEPEEIFTWVVTKAEVHWARGEFKGPHIVGKITGFRLVGQGPRYEAIGELIKSPNLAGGVKALRCGLDATLWSQAGPDPCSRLLDLPAGLKPGAGDLLPFDLARSNALYKALFGELEDVIAGKQLLIVPSGPLTQLPFQVLVQSIPADAAAGEYTREIPFLGVELHNLNANSRARLKWTGEGGVELRELPDGVRKWSADGTSWIEYYPPNPAKAAGIKTDDILAGIGNEKIASAEQAVQAIRAMQPGSVIHLGVWRQGQTQQFDVTLAGYKVTGWRPMFMKQQGAGGVPWLVRDHALSVLPAVSSLKALRRVARASTATKPWIGFGNPLLNGPDSSYASLAARARGIQGCLEAGAQNRRVAFEAHSSIAAVPVRGGLADTASIREAPPLPETADELCATAADLHAGSDSIFLGTRATEHQVKRLSASGQLAQYRIVHFATHGALAGQLNGTSEPGLILTPPQQPSADDDGYLSASEIARLKLDADWVILSACNTAAGGQEGAEALSGLARAFFYAQARALLVSHWEVDSNATVKLITAAAASMSGDRDVGRAEALRRAMLALIEKGSQNEAHPAYWAPFVVVGEGAR